MNFNEMTKKQTGIVFLIVYILTMIIGAFIYVWGAVIFFHPILAMLIADIAMTIIIFVVGSIIKNASLYDPYWSVMPLFMVILWVPFYVGSYSSLHVILIIVSIGFWAIRLTYNWWKNWEGFKKQDWRYDMLRDKNKKLYPITNFFGIHLIPTLVVFLQMIVIYKVLIAGTYGLIFFVGLLISLSAPVIQYISDKQMFDFRTNNPQSKTVINVGLWRFSRHPNYFGELSFWVGFYIMYVGIYGKLDYYILFPISMILLFVFISIPMMEKKLIRREGYEEYKNSVSMVIPFFRKQNQ